MKKIQETMTRFPEKVLGLLEKADVTQAKASRAIGVDSSQFARWMKGEGKPTVRHLVPLARFLGVTVEYLWDDAMEEPERVVRLPRDEALVLKVYRQSGMDLEEAINRLGMRLETIHDPRPDDRS